LAWGKLSWFVALGTASFGSVLATFIWFYMGLHYGRPSAGPALPPLNELLPKGHSPSSDSHSLTYGISFMIVPLWNLPRLLPGGKYVFHDPRQVMRDQTDGSESSRWKVISIRRELAPQPSTHPLKSWSIGRPFD